MVYFRALAVKFVMTFVILWLILRLFYANPIGPIFLLAITITVIGFIVGDLYFLPRFENWGATIADFLLILVILSLFNMYVHPLATTILTTAGITAILLSIGEFFYHKYLDTNLLHIDNRTVYSRRDGTISSTETEFSKEPYEGFKEDRHE